MQENDRAPHAISIRGLRRAFRSGWSRKRHEVLRGVDLELSAGASLGLVGPNGSGKSTLLRLVAGVDEPDGGELRVLGADPLESDVVRRIGYLPEESPFPLDSKPRAVLELIAGLHGVPRLERRARAEAMLVRVGLADVARKALGKFSRGMLRRFGLAQAFVHEPELLLLDEPTAGLDALGFEVAASLVADARARGASLVIASHLVDDLHRQCDEIAVLLEGRIVARGTALELARALGRDARVDLSVGGLDEGGLDVLRAKIAELGATFHGSQPSQHDLLALYRRHGARGST